ncbi:SRPBCC family protein [Chloroflexi bacterium TSY]|nr:SRPBCC family protein [Chloroflexi bacterium TSY]
MIRLQDAAEIEATPKQIFDWLTHLPENYLRWHPDHVACRYLQGDSMDLGTVLYVEEVLHGQLHKLTLCMTKVIPERHMEYTIMPGMKGAFDVEPQNDHTLFVATITMGIDWPVLGPMLDWILRTLFRRRIHELEQHMAEEGENLRLIFGANEDKHQIHANLQTVNESQGGTSSVSHKCPP